MDSGIERGIYVYFQWTWIQIIYVQNEDLHTLRPQESDLCDIDFTLKKLNKAILKQDWGMIWCK